MLFGEEEENPFTHPIEKQQHTTRYYYFQDQKSGPATRLQEKKNLPKIAGM